MTRSAQNSGAGRKEILDAATDLFAESGFDAVSMSTIAARSGTSKANVFHHFGTKDALYLEVMRAACSQFAPSIEMLADRAMGFEQRLSGFVREDLATMRAQPEHTHLIMREILDSGPCRGRALAEEVLDEQFGRIVELFREGQAAGEIAQDVPAAAAASMLISCNVFMFQSQHVLRHLPSVDFVDDPERYAALVGRVLLNGLRAAQPEAVSQGEYE